MGSIISGFTGSAKKARRAQVRAAEDANRALGETRDTNIAQLQPQIDFGNQGTEQLMMRLGIGRDRSNPLFGSLMNDFTGEDLANTPGFQFGMDQGMQALNRTAAARGGLLSGQALKGAQRFGQDYAGTKFQEGFNRDAANKGRVASFLGNVSNMGINAINNANNIRTNAALQYGANTMGAGNAVAASHIAQGNAWDSVFNTVAQGALAAATGGLGGAGGAAGGAAGAGKAAAAGGFPTGAMSTTSGFMQNPNFLRSYLGMGG